MATDRDVVLATRPMAVWRRWLFNRLLRLEELALARSLGLPQERVFVVDLREDA